MCPSSGSIYEPLKLSNLQREDEPLWEKLDRYYNAGKNTYDYWPVISGVRQGHLKVWVVVK